jgi:hypothetical protein
MSCRMYPINITLSKNFNISAVDVINVHKAYFTPVLVEKTVVGA